MEMKDPSTTTQPHPPSGGVWPKLAADEGGMTGLAVETTLEFPKQIQSSII